MAKAEGGGAAAVLFKKGAEGKIRQALIERHARGRHRPGLNIFYGTQLAACVMVFKRVKPAERRGKVLFVDGAEEARWTGPNFPEEEHVSQLFEWFEQFEDVENHVKVATMDDPRKTSSTSTSRSTSRRSSKTTTHGRGSHGRPEGAWDKTPAPKPAKLLQNSPHEPASTREVPLRRRPCCAAPSMPATTSSTSSTSLQAHLRRLRRGVRDRTGSHGDREYAGFAEHHRFQIPKGAH